MTRGEIFLANLSPATGSETDKTRPVLIVSNNLFNQHATLVTVVPVSGQISKVYPFQVILPATETGLLKDSKAKCEQIRTIDKKRLIKKLGQITAQHQLIIDAAIKLHLSIA
ncbi:MAG: type II toxin-antitoxin system PemK/MazF family toxin [Bacillota bacterium]